MYEMTLAIPTLGWEKWTECVLTWAFTSRSLIRPVIYVMDNTKSKSTVVASLDSAYRSTTTPLLGYVHDDVIMHETGWDVRVLREFDDPGVGLVGFGGALGHGDPMMYQKPYELPQLARQGYLSNVDDAEVHGRRFQGECDVAVLDGFALFVRREILDKAGGWPLNTPVDYIGYDYWLCCITRELGYRIRLIGVSCVHLGGKSTGLSQLPDHFSAAHRYIYDRFRDVLPYRVP